MSRCFENVSFVPCSHSCEGGISHVCNDSVVMSCFVRRWSGRGCLGSSGGGTRHRSPPTGCEPSAPEWQTPGAAGHVWHQCQVYCGCSQIHFCQLNPSNSTQFFFPLDLPLIQLALMLWPVISTAINVLLNNVTGKTSETVGCFFSFLF